MGIRRDRLQWGFLVCCVGFVFLADCASTHVVFDEFSHFSAFIDLAEEMGRVRYSGVSRKGMIVVQAKDFTSLFEIFRELDLGKAHSWKQHHFFIVILSLVNTKGLGQEVGRDVMLAGDVLKCEVEFH